jgi:hypothetical protein
MPMNVQPVARRALRTVTSEPPAQDEVFAQSYAVAAATALRRQRGQELDSSWSMRVRSSAAVTGLARRPARLPSGATNQVWGRAVTDQLLATPPVRPALSYTVG